MVQDVEVAVIGGGASGLHAAWLLQAHGYSVAVLEARPEVGGRLRSHAVEGGRVDVGATWFWPNEPLIASLVAQLGIETFAQHLSGDMLFQTDEGTKRIAGNQLDVASGRFTGGAQHLAERLAGSLSPGTVRLGTTINRVLVFPDRLDVRSEGGDTWRAQHVVVALPPALAVALIDFGDLLSETMHALASATPVWMGAMTKVVAIYDRPFWREQGLAGAAFSHVGPMRELHDMSGVDGMPAALFGFASPGEATAAPTEDEVRTQLAALFGPRGGQPVELHIADWRAEPYTSPSNVEHLADYQTFGHRHYQTASAGGRLHWASTETARDAPGHIEGALSASARAAHAISADLSHE